MDESAAIALAELVAQAKFHCNYKRYGVRWMEGEPTGGSWLVFFNLRKLGMEGVGIVTIDHSTGSWECKTVFPGDRREARLPFPYNSLIATQDDGRLRN
jgi:hypothetical protein